jgi:hypothetical protein
MAMDKDANTNKYVGFNRKEMGGEMLAGTENFKPWAPNFPGINILNPEKSLKT